jgi:hypothetical protein
LSFGGVPERVVVPFDAVTAFYDPAVQFGFQFETIDGTAELEADEGPTTAEKMEKMEKAPAAIRAVADDKRPEALPGPSEAAAAAPDQGPGGEVVRLDRFRKK